ncbi:MAG TPA: VWA domain-containing protein, partial [Cystobacter sp.]
LDCLDRPLTSQVPDNAFEIFERDRRLSSESQLKIVPEPKHFASYSVLLLDVSGSMSQQLPALVESATRFIRILIPEGTGPEATVHRIAIYAFDGSIKPLSGFSTDADALINTTLAKIRDEQSCKANGICQDSRTRLNGALVQGIDAVKAARDEGKNSGLDFTTASVVLFTDGRDTINVPTDAVAQESVTKSDANIFAIGLKGTDMDAQSVKSLQGFGKNGFALAEKVEELGSKFETIAGNIRNISNSYFQLRYCSPLESNRNKLTIKVSHEGVTAQKDLTFDVVRSVGGTCSVDSGGTGTP